MTDLDVEAPDEVPAVLRTAAAMYQESATELDAAWQQKSAGRPWIKIAKILERAADQIEREI